MNFTFFLITFSFLSLNVAMSNEPAPTQNKVDIVHEKVSKSVTGFSYRIDKFFGSKRGEDSSNGTQIKLAYITSKTESEKLDHGGIVKFRLKLPYLESLLKFSYSTDEEEPSKNEKTEGEAKEQSKTPIKKEPKKPKTWGININTGIQVEIPPQFFTNFRIRKSFFLGEWELRGAQEFFWFSRDGFGETSTIDLDRPLNPSLLFRLRNTATWTDDEDLFSSSHGPILFWALDELRALSFSVTASGTSDPMWRIVNYQGAINYRQLLYKRWFYLETGPTINYAKENNWSPVMNYFVKLEVIFGNY